MAGKIKKTANSFKVKITLWFSLALFGLCVVMFSAVLLLYCYTEKLNIIETLTMVVNEFTDEIQQDEDIQEYLINDASTDSSSDLFFYEKGTFLAVYREDGSRCAGNFLAREEDRVPFTDYEIQETYIEGIACTIYDRKIQTKSEIFWLRGAAYTDFGLEYVLQTIKNLLYVVPVIFILTLIGGYWLAGRFLKPVTQIADTAEKIRNSGNLANRIEIKDNGDELAQLAETFNRMFEKLEQNFEAERQFTSNASHELRTPVAVIQAQCEYAIENIENPEELWEVIAAIQGQGYRMSKLIETLLIFTRIEQKTEMYPLQKENISEIVRTVCTERQMILEKQITLHMEIEPDIKRPVNRELLRLLVNNLLQNACRYGRENGNIYVGVRKKEEKAEISVRDDGIGISEDEISHIWERFYRSDKSRSKKGMGLGLSLVKQIAEYHGGKVSVFSEEGKGSEFRVII